MTHGAPTGQPPTRRPRRHDPRRRDRLVDATLAVLAERGVAGTTHRAIARAADVPLGSTTYHFACLNEILAEAFGRHADTLADTLEDRMRTAPNRAAAIEALVQHLCADLLDHGPHLILTVELYTAAAHDPGLRDITQAWTRRRRQSLERHFTPDTAHALDALAEGAALHSALSTDPIAARHIRQAIYQLAGP